MSVPPPPVPQAVDRGNRLLGRPADVYFHTILLNNYVLHCGKICYSFVPANPQANNSWACHSTQHKNPLS